MWSKLYLGFIFTGLGICFCLICKDKYEVGQKAAVDPVPARLADLEAGKPTPNVHLLIGPHYAIFSESQGRYKKARFDFREADNDTRLDCVYYPIVSPAHPYIREWRKLEKQFKDQPIPIAIRPKLKKFSVLVKTNKLKKGSEIPDEDPHQDSLQGLVINDFLPLEGAEVASLQQSFPDLDFSSVVILHADREPSTRADYILELLIGSTIATVGGIILISTVVSYFRRKPTPPRYFAHYQPAGPPADGDNPPDDPSATGAQDERQAGT